MSATRTSTNPAAQDARLRGRTYAISFDRVWSAAHALAGGGLSGWRVLQADDEQGVILAEASSPVWRRTAQVRVRVSLDANAQTRVDLMASTPGQDWGSNVRRIARFTSELDRALAATPAQILDATRQPQVSA